MRNELEEEKQKIEEAGKIASQLMDADPHLPFYAALTIAQDRLSADRSTKWVESGEKSVHDAQVFVGSYARLDWSIQMMERGFFTKDELLDQLPELWSFSDPDDTDPRFLPLWKEAFKRNKNHYIRAGRPLPRGKFLTVYRGQDDGAPFGIAWSTDPRIAEKFARGAATRQQNRAGTVYRALIRRDKVLAYLTERGESEVILDPADLR